MCAKMEQIKVNLGNRTYEIEIGEGILSKIDFNRFKASKYAIVTDSNVNRLYGLDLRKQIGSQDLDVEVFSLPPGEGSKMPEYATRIGRRLAEKDFDRDSIIIALGGGVVGDLAGYVASFYKRGIGYIQIPTTLLAQVDSSIGGKTAVNIPEGKNLFGSFHQPIAVITDIATLQTLPEKEIKNGLAEIIKYGMIKDYELFKFLEQNYAGRTPGLYLELVKRSCKIKAEIVEKDETEQELRKILNYGHTVGHAIEASDGYKISHGEAVALGMVYEGKISARLELLSQDDLKRQNNLIKSIGLSTRYRGNIEILIKLMKQDKKTKSDKLYFILPTMIGGVKEEKGKISFPVEESLVRECLRN